MPLDAGFLAMLTMQGVWEGTADADKWGNEQWKAPVPIKCFITEQTVGWGRDDGNNQQERRQVVSMTIITDALGIELGDKITAGGHTVYVTAVDTPKDEVGVDLMHTLSTSTEKEG